MAAPQMGSLYHRREHISLKELSLGLSFGALCGSGHKVLVVSLGRILKINVF